jgi:hypothetical protein
MSISREIKRTIDEVARHAKRAAREAATVSHNRQAGGNTANVAGRANFVTTINSGSKSSEQAASASQTTRVRQQHGTQEVSETTSHSSRSTTGQ